VERARGSASRYASLVLSLAAFYAFSREDFRQARDLWREAAGRVRMSAHAGEVLAMKLLLLAG
jgi:hypothetical protein